MAAKKNEVERPSAEPGDADFDWQSEYPDEKVFVYTTADKRTIGLAAISDKRKIKPGQLRKARLKGEQELLWVLIERISSPASLELSDELEDDEYRSMVDAWAEWNETTTGE